VKCIGTRLTTAETVPRKWQGNHNRIYTENTAWRKMIRHEKKEKSKIIL
jgi:hypothetical protein